MNSGIAREDKETIKLIMWSIVSALKHGGLYQEDHPLFLDSARKVFLALGQWFHKEEYFEFGIAQDSLLFAGEMLKQEEVPSVREIAEHLHRRGLAALSFSRGLNEDQVVRLFTVLKKSPKQLKEDGGISEELSGLEHIAVKALDYSDLLSGVSVVDSDEEADVWRSLSDLSGEAGQGKLPETRIEFLADFLKDQERSASVLDNVYKKALSEMEGKEQVANMADIVSRLCTYFDKQENGKGLEMKEDLAYVISKLDPDLILRLFEHAQDAGGDFDLAEELTKDLSDDFIATFIDALITREGQLNEKVLKIFDKLSYSKERTELISMKVMEDLEGRGFYREKGVADLQRSIKDIFEKMPDSQFMSQMYKITVDTFLDRKEVERVKEEKLSPLVESFHESMKSYAMPVLEADLYLNLLSLEKSPAGFGELCRKMETLLPVLTKGKIDPEIIWEIVVFFTRELSAGQKDNAEIVRCAGEIMKKMKDDRTVERIVTGIDSCEEKGMEKLAEALCILKTYAADFVLDRYIFEQNREKRRKIGMVLSGMKEKASDSILEMLNKSPGTAAVELMGILGKTDPEKAYQMSRKLLAHKDDKAVEAGLELFQPKTDADRNTLAKLIKTTSSVSVREKAFDVLVKTSEKDELDELFGRAKRVFSNKGLLEELIKACGRIKDERAVGHLERILFRKRLFGASGSDELMVLAVSSLTSIGTKPAMDLVGRGLDHPRAKVRKRCEIGIKLSQGPRNVNGVGS